MFADSEAGRPSPDAHDSQSNAGPEVMYAVRRADGDLIGGDFGFLGISDPSERNPE